MNSGGLYVVSCALLFLGNLFLFHVTQKRMEVLVREIEELVHWVVEQLGKSVDKD